MRTGHPCSSSWFVVRARQARAFMARVHVPRGTVRPSADVFAVLILVPHGTRHDLGSDRFALWRQDQVRQYRHALHEGAWFHVEHGTSSVRTDSPSWRRYQHGDSTASCGCRVPRGTGHGPAADASTFVTARPARRRHTPPGAARFHVEQAMAPRRSLHLRGGETREATAHATWGCTVPRGTGHGPAADASALVTGRPARRRHTPHGDARFHVEQAMAPLRTLPPSLRGDPRGDGIRRLRMRVPRGTGHGTAADAPTFVAVRLAERLHMLHEDVRFPPGPRHGFGADLFTFAASGSARPLAHATWRCAFHVEHHAVIGCQSALVTSSVVTA